MWADVGIQVYKLYLQTWVDQHWSVQNHLEGPGQEIVVLHEQDYLDCLSCHRKWAVWSHDILEQLYLVTQQMFPAVLMHK